MLLSAGGGRFFGAGNGLRGNQRYTLMVMHSVGKRRRALAELLVALGIAAALGIINLGITYLQAISDFFARYRQSHVTDIVINVLFFWLLLLLVLAFRRWRSAVAAGLELEDIISSISPDALLVVMPNRDIVMCNSAVEHMFGYTPEDIIGKKTELLYHDRRTSQAHPREVYEALQRDGFHLGEAKGCRRDGSDFPLEIIAGELAGRTGAVLLLRDISERQEAEDRRYALEERIRQQQKTESLGILAAGVAHDFNNLLTVIQGNAQLLDRTIPAESGASECLQAIRTAGERAAGMCRQMLAYAGEGEFSIEPLNLSDVVGKTARLLGVSLGTRVRLHCHLDDKLPTVRGDAVQLQQVVMNLVINASEAIGDTEGSITVLTGVKKLDEAAIEKARLNGKLAPGRYAYIRVEDTGCGIDEETRLRICDPFFTTKATGRGLGLASVVGIVRSHKGLMDVESTPGKGSTFSVFLPCDVPPAASGA